MWVGSHTAGAQATGPPLKPASLVVLDVGNQQVTLRWVAGGDGGSPIIGWQYRASTDGTLDTEAWQDLGGGVRSHTVRSLTNGQQYSFQVRALNDFDGDASTPNAGPASDTVTATPSATASTAPERPRLSASGGDARVELRFETLDDGGSALRGWRYRSSTDTGANKTWSEPASIDSTAPRDTHEVTGLTNGTGYFFQVSAANDADGDDVLDWSEWSESAAATPLQPIRPNAATVTGTSMVVTFSGTLDTMSVPGTDQFTVVVDDEVAGISSVSVAAAQATLTLAEAVKAPSRVVLHYTRGSPALQGASDAPVPGFSGLAVTVGTANAAPVLTMPPATLTVAENSPPGTALLVSGTSTAAQFAATDANGDNLTFSLRDTVAGSGAATPFAIDAGTGHVTVAAGQQVDHETSSSHAVTVEVTDGVATATHDVTISVTNEDRPGTPGAVLRVDTAGNRKFARGLDGEIRIDWTAPTSNGGAAVTAYRIYWYKTADVSNGTLAEGQLNSAEIEAATGGQNFSITGLTNGTVYGIGVTAVNREGEGAFSYSTDSIESLPYPATGMNTELRTLTPDRFPGLSAGDFRLNRKPRNVVVTAAEADKLKVTWDAPTNTSGSPQHYRVRWSATNAVPNPDNDTECAASCAQVSHDASALEHTITGLTRGESYSVSVQYHFKEDSGAENVFVTAATASATAVGAAGAPANVVLTPGDGTIDVAWDAPSSTGGLPLARYEVRWGTAGGTKGAAVDVGSATEHTVTGVSNEQEHEVEVRFVGDWQAKDGGAGTAEGAWAMASATPNADPTSGPVRKRTTAGTSVTLALTDFPFSDDAGDQLTELILAEAPPVAQGRLHAGGSNLVAGSRVARAVLAGTKPLTFVPALGFDGTAAFTFRVADGDGAESGTSRAEVQVQPTQTAAERPVVSRLSLVSDAGTDQTYITGDEVEVRVEFSSAVTVTGVPQLALQFPGGGGVPHERIAIYKRGSGTPELVFGYTVAAGDSASGGIGIGQNALVGVIKSMTARMDGSFDDASLAAAEVAADPLHTVDAVLPVPSPALRLSGTMATISFSRDLAATTPDLAAFSVDVAGSEDAPAVMSVRVDGSELVLEFAGAVSAGQTVTVTYTAAQAGAGALRDVVGNRAADFEVRHVRPSFAGGGGIVVAPQRRGVVVVVQGWNPADVGIAASTAARLPDATVLYVDAHGLAPSAVAELIAFDPARVLVIGGTTSVSSGQSAAVGRAAGVEPRRLAGDTRVATAVAAARSVFAASPQGGGGRTIVIANGWRLDDIAAAALAAADADNGAVLYTRFDTLPAETGDALRRHQPSRVVIVGGLDAVSAAVRDAIAAALPSADIISHHATGSIEASAERARAALEASAAAGRSRRSLVLVNSSSYADVGAAAVLSAHIGDAVVLLTGSAALPPAAEVLLRDHRFDQAFIIGGHAVVSAELEAQVRAALGGSSSVVRLGGSDRVDTLAAVARQIRRTPR